MPWTDVLSPYHMLSDAPRGWTPLWGPGSFSLCPRFGMGNGVVAEWSAAPRGGEQPLMELCACWGEREGPAS